MREYSKSTRRRGSGVWAWPDAVKRLGGGRAMDGAEERDAVTGGRVQVASSRYLSWGGGLGAALSASASSNTCLPENLSRSRAGC